MGDKSDVESLACPPTHARLAEIKPAGRVVLAVTGMATDKTNEEEWRRMLTEGEAVVRQLHRLYGLLPASPRCKLCAARIRIDDPIAFPIDDRLFRAG